MNKTMLIGNVGQPPEIKESNGRKFCKFSVATNEKFKGDVVTTWHDIVCWNEKLTEVIEKYVDKGTQLYVEGKIEKREYEGKTYINIKLDYDGKIELLGSKPKPKESPTSQEFDDDIPWS